MSNFNWDKIVQILMEKSMEYAPKLLLGIISLIIGLWLAKWVGRLISRAFKKKDGDQVVSTFIASVSTMFLRILVIISVASIVGVEMTSFIAILSAMSLAIGLAFQGSLANFAGGVLLIILRPFKAGDYIEAQGHSGVVAEMQVFHTVLKTVDNKEIIIPNGPLANGNIVNYSSQKYRRIDLEFGISYKNDFNKAKKIIADIIAQDNRILNDNEHLPFARVGKLDHSSINITVRVWSASANYWDIHFDLIEKVKLAFDKNGIEVPFPQQDIHLFNKN